MTNSVYVSFRKPLGYWTLIISQDVLSMACVVCLNIYFSYHTGILEELTRLVKGHKTSYYNKVTTENTQDAYFYNTPGVTEHEEKPFDKIWPFGNSESFLYTGFIYLPFLRRVSQHLTICSKGPIANALVMDT